MISLSSLKFRLVALVVGGCIPIGILALLLGKHYYQFSMDEAREKAVALSRLAASAHEDQIHDAGHLLTTLAAIPEIRDRRAGYCDTIADVLKQHAHEYANLGLVNPEGDVLCSGAPDSRPVNLKGYLWLQDALKQKAFVVSDYRIGGITGRPIVMVAQPVADASGQARTLLFAAVDLEYSKRFDVMAALPEKSIVTLFNQDGLILQRYPEPEQWVGRQIPTDSLFRNIKAAGGNGVIEATGADGYSRLFSIVTLESKKGEAYLAIGIPAELAYARVHKQILLAAAAILLAMLAMPLLTIVMGNRLIGNRLARLTDFARRLTRGDFLARADLRKQKDEIGELAHAMDALGEALQKRERELTQHLRAINAHAIVSATDVAGNIVQVNDKFCETSQYAREELIGRNHRLLNSGLHPRAFFEEMWETVSRGEVWHGSIRNRRKDGSYYWVASTIVPFVDETGLPAGYLSIRTDITQSLAIGEALQKSEERFRLLAENAQDVITLHDPHGRFLYASPSCLRVTGYTQAEMIGHGGYEFVHPDDRARVERELHGPLLEGRPSACEYYRILHKDGHYIWVEASASPTRDAAGNIVGLQISVRDVTARKEMEDTLVLHDRAIAASANGIVILRRDGRVIEYANQAFAQMVGMPAQALQGEPWPVLLPAQGSADDWSLLSGAVSAGVEWYALVEGVSQQGRHVWCDIFLSPVQDSGGETTHCVAAILDVSERVAMEKELVDAKEAAEKANKAKSEFLSQISHELRTPLNAIVGFAQLLESDPEAPLTETQQWNVKRILRAGWLLHELVSDVLDLSRIEAGRMTLQLEEVDVAGVIMECLDMIRASAEDKRLAIDNLVGGCARLTAIIDPVRLKQVLLNLLSNAVKYNRDGGRITVACHCQGNDTVRIAVSDTGAGIPQERHGELFQHFSRLGADRSGIPGAGVGLALCRRIMELMGGSIGFASAEREGSTFWIEFQSMDCAAAYLPPGAGEAQPETGCRG